MPTWIANEPEDVRRQAAQWLAQPAFEKMLHAFGIDRLLDPDELATWSASVLDTRDGHERRDAPTVKWEARRVQAIIEAAGDLGLLATDPPYRSAYAVTLILGGAATGNRLRTQLVHDLESAGVGVGTIVALATNRAISPSEHLSDPESTDDATEWMHLLRCVNDLFGPLEPPPQDTPATGDAELDNTFVGRGGGAVRFLITPETANRRPTTVDTLTFLLNRIGAKELSPILVVTSAIYVPYQFFAGVPTLLGGGVRPVELVGTSTSRTDDQLLAQRLGQELHAAITWAGRAL